MRGAVDYRTYIRSHAWKRKAQAARERARFKCQLCGGKDQRLEVHHNTYERLGREAESDLVCLCERCHKLHHVGQRYSVVLDWVVKVLTWLWRR